MFDFVLIFVHLHSDKTTFFVDYIFLDYLTDDRNCHDIVYSELIAFQSNPTQRWLTVTFSVSEYCFQFSPVFLYWIWANSDKMDRIRLLTFFLLYILLC